MDGGILNPHPEGTVDKGRPVLDENGFIEKFELNVGQARNLRGFAEEFAFFTPAILYLRGGFRDAPLADLSYMTGVNVRFYYRKFARPIFRGLDSRDGDKDWNHALWAVRREHWRLVSDWLVSITLTYSEVGEVAGIGEQRLVVTDPLAVERTVIYHGGLPTLEVSAFGINGSKFRAYLKPGADLPGLAFDPPAEDMRVFAAALYGGGNPVDARSAHNWKQKLKEETDAG